MTQLLDIKVVAARLGVSRRTAFHLARTPGFPRAIRLSARCVRWREADIDHWIAAQVSEG